MRYFKLGALTLNKGYEYPPSPAPKGGRVESLPPIAT